MPGPVRNAASQVGEAIVKPVSDEVGKAIEEGVQAITGNYKQPQAQDPNLNPAVQAQKQQLDNKKRQNIMRFISQYNTDKQILQQQKVKEQQKKQQEVQEDQEKKMKVRQIEVVKNQQKQTLAQQQARSRSERKGGVGG